VCAAAVDGNISTKFELTTAFLYRVASLDTAAVLYRGRGIDVPVQWFMSVLYTGHSE